MIADATVTFTHEDEVLSMTVSELEAWNWWKGWKPPTISGFVPHDGLAVHWVWIRGRQIPLTWTQP